MIMYTNFYFEPVQRLQYKDHMFILGFQLLREQESFIFKLIYCGDKYFRSKRNK